MPIYIVGEGCLQYVFLQPAKAERLFPEIPPAGQKKPFNY